MCSLKGPVSGQRKAHAAIHDKMGVNDMDDMLMRPKLNLFPHKPVEVYI